MNTDAPWPSVDDAQTRVLEIQTKLHRWAGENATLRFDDLYNRNRLDNYRIDPNGSGLPFSNFAVAGPVEPAPI